MLIRILISLYLCFLVPHWAFAQVDTIELPPNLNDIEWQTPLLDKAYIADKIPFNLSFNQIQKIGFELFQKDSVFIKDDKCAWLHFKVKNPNLTDTLTFFVTFNGRIHKAYLFSEIRQKVDSIEGGKIIDYYKRPFRENKSCFKLVLPPHGAGSYWLKFNNFSENRTNLSAQLMSTKKEEKVRLADEYSHFFNRMFSIFYISLFAILTLVASLMAYVWLDEGYKWYAVYIGLTGLFYFRELENTNNTPVIFFSYFGSWHFEIEATLCYLMYIAYMIFIQKFLDMKQFYPSLNTRFTWAIRILFICLILDLLIHTIWGIAVSFPIFMFIRIIFFLYYFVVLFQIAFGTSSALSRFILLGTFCMLVPGITSNLCMVLGGDSKILAYGQFRLYDFPNFKIPMFNTQLGIALESCFFIIGLSWKSKRENKELRDLISNQNNFLSTNIITSKIPLSNATFEMPQQPITEEEIGKINEIPLENAGEQEKKTDDPRVIEAFTHLEKMFQNPDFSVTKWAKTVYLSSSYFSDIIEKETQERPLTHIQRRRLQYAQKLMLTTNDLTLAQIAFNSGYHDNNYFSRIFKKTFGLKPSEWQKLNKKK